MMFCGQSSHKLFTIKFFYSPGNKSNEMIMLSSSRMLVCYELLRVKSNKVLQFHDGKGKKASNSRKFGNVAKTKYERMNMSVFTVKSKLDFLIFHASNESDCEGS